MQLLPNIHTKTPSFSVYSLTFLTTEPDNTKPTTERNPYSGKPIPYLHLNSRAQNPILFIPKTQLQLIMTYDNSCETHDFTLVVKHMTFR
jgi:hypothetical protein